MKPDLAVRLLHQCQYATLATPSLQDPGYPYATAVQFFCDERQQPVFLASALAEHSKNLLADHRISLSLLTPGEHGAQSAARLTMLGDAESFEPDMLLRQRLLRYLPEAEEWLALDFAFFRLRPKRQRLIAGLGRMGWIDEHAWRQLPVLSLEAERRLLEEAQAALPAAIRLLGCDCFGSDYLLDGRYHRADWGQALSGQDQIRTRLLRLAPQA